MEESIQNNDTNLSVWDWRGFVKKGARSRVLVLVLYSVFQSWNGGSIIGQVGLYLYSLAMPQRRENASLLLSMDAPSMLIRHSICLQP